MPQVSGQIRVVCITGPFGSGKTSLARYLQKEYKIPTLYMDLVGHYMLTKKSVVDEIVELLGEDVLLEGKVSRRLVAEKVFSNRQVLEAYNTLIWAHMDEFIGNLLPRWLDRFGRVIIEAAVLHEAGWCRYCDKTIAVLAPLREVLRRNGLDMGSYCLRRKWQLSDREYATRADFVLCNRGTPSEMVSLAKDILARWGFLSAKEVYDL